MIQKKQLRSSKSFKEEIDMEKLKNCLSRVNKVTKKSSKVDVQSTKTKKSSMVGATNKSVSKKIQ